MMDEGILRLIGEIIVNETDPLVLVCLLRFYHSFIILYQLNYFHIQKVTLLLSSAIVAEWGLDTKDCKEVTRDLIGNILRMIMVSFL